MSELVGIIYQVWLMRRRASRQLLPAGKKALDGLVKSGKLDPMTRYGIEVHTDNIGEKGEASPVGQCSDTLPKEKLVKCLVPNRRVTIDPAY